MKTSLIPRRYVPYYQLGLILFALIMFVPIILEVNFYN